MDTATGNIDAISGAVEDILNAEAADDTAFIELSGKVDSISGTVDLMLGTQTEDDERFNLLSEKVNEATGDLYSFYKKEDNSISNVKGNFTTLSFGTTDIPQNGNSPGTAGQITYDNNYVYICVSDNNWRKLLLVDFE